MMKFHEMRKLQQLQLFVIVSYTLSTIASFESASANAFSFFSPSNNSPSLFQSRRSEKDQQQPPSPPPPPTPPNNPRLSFGDHFDDEDDDNFIAASILGIGLNSNNDEVELEADKDLDKDEDKDEDKVKDNINNDTPHLTIRGGSDEIIAGTKSTLQSTTNYWSNAFESFQSKVGSTIQSLNPFSKSTKDNGDDDDDDDISNMQVQNVAAPGSTILPDMIIRSAGQRSGLVGSVMRSDKVQECAKQLKKWYLQRGYVLHAVTGATLHAENGTATLTVQEPKSSYLPLDIKFAKLVPIDPDSGEQTTMRKYKMKLEQRRGRCLRVEEWDKIKSALNTTLVEAKGRTNPKTLSKRLGLEHGGHFKWDGQLWQNIAQSGIFARVWRASPVQMSDGSVQVQVVAQESPPRNLEYGVQKSLYTGNWEGELDFKHENILGGGESLGLSIKRGAKDPIPSVKIQFTDDKFGMAGGYDAELFSEYIALGKSKSKSSKKGKGKEEASDDAAEIMMEREEVDEESSIPDIASATNDDNDDEILTRRGLRFNLRTPISTEIVERSRASTSLERTSTRSGQHETIASATMGLGPFVRNLPLGAKTSFTTSVTPGTRVGSANDSSLRLFPYLSQVSVARQLFPILLETLSFPSGDTIKLALETTLMSSTKHLPRHEANAAGLAARVRGYSSSENGPLGASLYGSAEVRIPVIIPLKQLNMEQDSKVVLFGDWLFGLKKDDTIMDRADKGFYKSSIGIGLRKTIQGIPVKYDMSLSQEGKIGAFFSLGMDWSIE